VPTQAQQQQQQQQHQIQARNLTCQTQAPFPHSSGVSGQAGVVRQVFFSFFPLLFASDVLRKRTGNCVTFEKYFFLQAGYA
jgi:hypothetical protein